MKCSGVVLVVLLIVHFCVVASTLSFTNVVFVILTQPHPYHTSLADNLKKEIITQAVEFQQKYPPVWITHDRGAWTILPLLENLATNHTSSASWVVFCDQHTWFNLVNLHKVLSHYNSDEEIWIGHGLRDVEPTIIHHFDISDDSEKFIYPSFAAGFAMSVPLIKTLHRRFGKAEKISYTEFSIDASYELAKFVWGDGKGFKLTHSPNFCIVSNDDCATYPRSHDTCGDPVPNDAMIFAVKTYSEFHDCRVKIVKNTWGKYAQHLIFFSDKNDSSIPTIDLGIQNTKRGHCAKTMAILKYLSSRHKGNSTIKWIVIADDDTILSVSRLSEVLSCYGEKNVALGERYGFNLLTGDGYDYLTGGGGLVFSIDVAAKLGKCKCPTPSSPDDMWLGVCLAKIKIPVVHSPLFHQARPVDYASEYLAPHRPISFHKHWMIDPVEVYKLWFENDDLKFKTAIETENVYRNEL